MTRDEHDAQHGEDGDVCRRCGAARAYCECHRYDDEDDDECADREFAEVGGPQHFDEEGGG